MALKGAVVQRAIGRTLSGYDLRDVSRGNVEIVIWSIEQISDIEKSIFNQGLVSL
jgi:hypothetical protein